MGVDDASREQYLYHDQGHRAKREEEQERVLELARLLPAFRKEVARQLSARGTGRERVLAGALRILGLGVFRTGGEEYARSNVSVATLQRDHVRLCREQIRFRHVARGGALREVVIADAALAALVRSLRRARPGTERLLAYRTGSGWREVQSENVDERYRELTGAKTDRRRLHRQGSAHVERHGAGRRSVRRAQDPTRSASAATRACSGDARGRRRARQHSRRCPRFLRRP